MPNKIVDIDGFTIIKRIGAGARTTIYLARDNNTGEKMALKHAVMEYPEDIRIFEQIKTEYAIAKKIDHPYIRKCRQIIKKRRLLRTTEILLSMEMFDGTSLEEYKGLSLGDFLLIFRMVAGGLNAMHERGYIHCDIKPNNILISKQGAIKIIDLGQSCKIGTIKARIQGTPDYIAPEQVKREHLSHRTDIFNFGATMYWALTGKNVPTLIAKQTDIGFPVSQKKEFLPPHQIYRKIPVEVSDIVMQCVSEKPAERPSNMSEIISRFDVMIRQIFASKIENAHGN